MANQYAPMILKRGKNKYILERVFEKNRYALYSEMTYGYNECFTFNELDMLRETVEPPKAYIRPEKVII